MWWLKMLIISILMWKQTCDQRSGGCRQWFKDWCLWLQHCLPKPQKKEKKKKSQRRAPRRLGHLFKWFICDITLFSFLTWQHIRKKLILHTCMNTKIIFNILERERKQMKPHKNSASANLSDPVTGTGQQASLFSRSIDEQGFCSLMPLTCNPSSEYINPLEAQWPLYNRAFWIKHADLFPSYDITIYFYPCWQKCIRGMYFCST